MTIIGRMPPEYRGLQVEAGRLERARRLACEWMGDRQYAVEGSRETHYIDLDGDQPCYCEDAWFEPRLACKHLLRALIADRDPWVLRWLEVIIQHNHDADA